MNRELILLPWKYDRNHQTWRRYNLNKDVMANIYETLNSNRYYSFTPKVLFETHNLNAIKNHIDKYLIDNGCVFLTEAQANII